MSSLVKKEKGPSTKTTATQKSQNKEFNFSYYDDGW